MPRSPVLCLSAQNLIIIYWISVEKLVGVAGFEPATPSPPVKCATRLRHTPTMRAIYAPRLSCAMGFAPIRRAPAGS